MNTSAYRLADQPEPLTVTGFVSQEWPYLLMIVLSIVGVAVSAVATESSLLFWQVLAPVFGLICIATQWQRVYPKGKHWRLVATQVLHWGIFALSMQLIFLPEVQRAIDAFMTGLILLYLLALGTFLVGVYYAAWRLCVVGVFLGLAVPVLALFEEWAMTLVLIGVVLIAAIYIYDRFRAGREDLAV
jgi:hypothetical protein